MEYSKIDILILLQALSTKLGGPYKKGIPCDKAIAVLE